MTTHTANEEKRDERFEYLPCNLCGADDYAVVYHAAPPDARKVTSDNYSAASFHILEDQVVKCNKCGFLYINPRPKSEMIVKGYSDAVDETYVSQSEGRLATFKEGLARIEKAYPQKGRILDVGCAAGFFVKTAKEGGWDAYGVEPSRWLAEWGNNNLGLNLKSGTLEEAAYPNNYFDVVTLWDVLEHVPDAAATLKEIHRILKPGGLVVVNYPNIGSNLAKVFGRKWWFLLSVHLYYFTPHTIKKMLEHNGYEMVVHKHHYQKLKIGYLVFRVKPYSKALFKVLNPLVQKLGLADKDVTYYASQSLAIGKKK
ncbi:hypothetical protein AUJ14_02945 [Candidatus Micrarchaeota archaeon CG1_02_55_22]|nr:MAG: hypothetical protein AUJ14_02945 [Candidatus Micrarchaeota archaeon CG1_02_55_22]